MYVVYQLLGCEIDPAGSLYFEHLLIRFQYCLSVFLSMTFFPLLYFNAYFFKLSESGAVQILQQKNNP